MYSYMYYIYIYIHVYIYIYIHIHIYIYIMRVYTYIYVYIYIYTQPGRLGDARRRKSRERRAGDEREYFVYIMLSLYISMC